MRLGQLIEALEIIAKKPKGEYGLPGKDRGVRFEMYSIVPTHLMSYRGYYDQIAVGYDMEDRPQETVTVEVFLALCKKALGQIFTGYKGGDFVMTADTKVWVANYGHCDGLVLDHVEDNDVWVILHVRKEEL